MKLKIISIFVILIIGIIIFIIMKRNLRSAKRGVYD